MTKDYHQLAGYVSAFPDARLLCFGDIMLDRYLYGDVSRVSAEAPVPIMRHERERVMLGGVGNVARNIVALGGNARITALVGDDDPGREIARLISEEEHLQADLVTVPSRQTTRKVRFVARGQQLLRADLEDTSPLDEKDERRVLDAFLSALPAADAVVLSDYAKGCLGGNVVRAAIAACRERRKPVLVDPKRRDLLYYDGVDLIKPNCKEMEAFTEVSCVDDASAVAAARKVLEASEIRAVLLTRSEHGMTLVERDDDPVHFTQTGREVYDVSGAGDTALAVVGLAVAGGASLAEATALANRACGIVVAKVGTATVHASELIQALHSAEITTAGSKIDPLVVVLDKIARWREQGLRIGFTNGCFDLIHTGHVSLLTQAKERCDRLIVGINSDQSVKRLKGPDRPINGEMARAMVLASLGAVDSVVLFEDDTPMSLLEAIRPDVLIKGADYREDQVVGAELVKGYGGTVYLAELAPDASTTSTINRIKG